MVPKIDHLLSVSRNTNTTTLVTSLPSNAGLFWKMQDRKEQNAHKISIKSPEQKVLLFQQYLGPGPASRSHYEGNWHKMFHEPKFGSLLYTNYVCSLISRFTSCGHKPLTQDLPLGFSFPQSRIGLLIQLV